MNEINTTPLVDVMLVLLVIFIITAPLVTHSIRLDLPRAEATPAAAQPSAVTLSIDADGRLFWNDEALGDAQALAARLATIAAAQPQPELQLRADRRTPYEPIAKAMSAAQRAGVTRIGFVTEPRDRR